MPGHACKQIYATYTNHVLASSRSKPDKLSEIQHQSRIRSDPKTNSQIHSFNPTPVKLPKSEENDENPNCQLNRSYMPRSLPKISYFQSIQMAANLVVLIVSLN